MDRNTLSNYGWIVIAVLVLSVMIALATPFGSYIEQGVRATTEGLFNTSKNAVNSAFEDLGVQMDDQTFEEGYTGVNGTSATKLPAKGKTLEEYTWAEVRDIIVAGKAEEYGFDIGSTKTLQINNETKTATIIGLDHDGENTATFMILSSGGIGSHAMNTNETNSGGWEASEMRTWLNDDIYNSMSNKDYVKEVTKMTNNIGENGNSVTGTSDKVFLLSPKETGIEWQVSDYWDEPDYVGMNALNSEGSTYAWFESIIVDYFFWLRSPYSAANSYFFNYDNGIGNIRADIEVTVCPAFVIG